MPQTNWNNVAINLHSKMQETYQQLLAEKHEADKHTFTPADLIEFLTSSSNEPQRIDEGVEIESKIRVLESLCDKQNLHMNSIDFVRQEDDPELWVSIVLSEADLLTTECNKNLKNPENIEGINKYTAESRAKAWKGISEELKATINASVKAYTTT